MECCELPLRCGMRTQGYSKDRHIGLLTVNVFRSYGIPQSPYRECRSRLAELLVRVLQDLIGALP